MHFFFRRRRERDIQCHVDDLCEVVDATVGALSLDIIYSAKADLVQDCFLAFWRNLIHIGKVAGLLSGPPCKTWSTARFEPLLGGPRPARSCDRP